jgi:hypothetical protein
MTPSVAKTEHRPPERVAREKRAPPRHNVTSKRAEVILNYKRHMRDTNILIKCVSPRGQERRSRHRTVVRWPTVSASASVERKNAHNALTFLEQTTGSFS